MIRASEGLAQVAVSCQHARRSFVPQCTFLFLSAAFSLFRSGHGFAPPPGLHALHRTVRGFGKKIFFLSAFDLERLSATWRNCKCPSLSLCALHPAAVLASYAPCFHTHFAPLSVFASELLRSVLPVCLLSSGRRFSKKNSPRPSRNGEVSTKKESNGPASGRRLVELTKESDSEGDSQG